MNKNKADIFPGPKKKAAGRIISLAVLAFALSAGSLKAQWVNDPSQNTCMVVDTHNPINISAVSNKEGGFFVFWEDTQNGSKPNISFQFIDKFGKPGFRNDGKKVSYLTGKKIQPLVAKHSGNSAVVIWKDYSFEAQGSLIAQRVFNNGVLGWSDNGLQITGKQNIVDYAISSDSSGNIFVAFIEKTSNDPSGAYKIFIQKISPNGYILFKSEGILVHKSGSRDNAISILADEEGGAFLFWLENNNSKSQLVGKHIDSQGKSVWGRSPILISSSLNNVLSFTAAVTDDQSVYIAWQAQGRTKDILHQLISFTGKGLWGYGGRLAVQSKQNQLNPNIAVSDSSLFLSWTNESAHNKDVYIQKYRTDGSPVWQESGVPVIKSPGDQFGQKIINDSKSGVFVAWIDKRVDSLKADIYGQRFNKWGIPLWDSLGAPLAKFKNSEKSYLSLLADADNNTVIIFKDKRTQNSEIYGQKIFSVSSVTPRPLGVKTSLVKDSIHVSWYNPSEVETSEFAVQKLNDSDPDDQKWVTIATIKKEESIKNYFEITEKSLTPGVLSYRVVMTDKDGESFVSEVSQVNNFVENSGIILGQNFPNPFSGSTVISFYLPTAAKISIEFYNSKLETVKEIQNQYYDAGETKITFTADDLPAGIYFYRLKAGTYVDVKKMVLVK
jgi:hypothetical protein